jgi:hypothetical protein
VKKVTAVHFVLSYSLPVGEWCPGLDISESGRPKGQAYGLRTDRVERGNASASLIGKEIICTT